MTETERKQYEEAAKEYVKRQGSHDRPHITHHDFMSGCKYAHSKIEEAEREAWNRALDDVIESLKEADSDSLSNFLYAEDVLEAINKLRK